MGDILGDWREEVVYTNSSYNELIIFTTNQPSSTRLYTLAHNPAYRNAMTLKGYMQSHHVGYFLGSGMSQPPRPNITYPTGTSPTTPPATTPPPPTTPPPSAGGCRVGYSVNAWEGGLTASITITNTGSAAIDGWSLAFTLPAGQTITSGWSAEYSPTSGAVTARNVSYNGAIPLNGSVSIGFQASHTENSGAPTSFTLNGNTCSIA